MTHIGEEVGSCLKEVGAILRVPTPAIENIESEPPDSRYEKAWKLLNKWKQQEGKDATVGKLVDALLEIKKKRIADELLGKSYSPSSNK